MKKTEHKFKEGDWVVDEQHNAHLIAYIDKENDKYLFEIGCHSKDALNYESIEIVDSQYHKWTIDDAEKGQILISKESNSIFTYDGNDNGFVKYDTLLTDYGELKTDGRYISDKMYNIYPATKTQRELFLAYNKRHPDFNGTEYIVTLADNGFIVSYDKDNFITVYESKDPTYEMLAELMGDLLDRIVQGDADKFKVTVKVENLN